jgi:5-methylcytosine-specific restriction endonuclease McrA
MRKFITRLKQIVEITIRYDLICAFNKERLMEKARKRRNRKTNERYKRVYGSNYCHKKKRYKKILFCTKGNKCFWCNKRIDYKKATIDHIKPISKGGSVHIVSNMRIIHNHCRIKRDRLISKGLLDYDYDKITK